MSGARACAISHALRGACGVSCVSVIGSAWWRNMLQFVSPSFTTTPPPQCGHVMWMKPSPTSTGVALGLGSREPSISRDGFGDVACAWRIFLYTGAGKDMGQGISLSLAMHHRMQREQKEQQRVLVHVAKDPRDPPRQLAVRARGEVVPEGIINSTGGSTAPG